jgi:GNAT superfamily N-acetyltransferase
MIARQRAILLQNGHVFGAFHEDKLVGVASLENKKRGTHLDFLKMDILYVNAAQRGQGIGARLVGLCAEKALQLGAKKLYVSATPTHATVDFYLKHGATLTSEIVAELYALEPEDIHLELKV